MSFLRPLLWVPSLAIAALWLVGGAGPIPMERIRLLASPVAFYLLDWETANLAERADRIAAGIFTSRVIEPVDRDAIAAFFAAPPDERESLRRRAESAIERAVTAAYVGEGLGGAPWQPARSLFPPVLVVIEQPPSVLIVSPRNELRVADSVLLRGISESREDQLEARADSSGVSTLVSPIGGLATFPAMIRNQGSSRDVLDAVAHEWLHHYLVFHPLGANYFNSGETRSINETVADMVGREMGARLYESLGLATPAPPQAPATAVSPPPAPARPAFDFRAFMRATRLEVERLLAANQIDQAESYMRAQRDELQRNGYNIRKLNQAYFAFYGSYAESAGASERSPLPGLLRSLRNQSGSLGAFVLAVRDVTTVEQLRALVQRAG